MHTLLQYGKSWMEESTARRAWSCCTSCKLSFPSSPVLQLPLLAPASLVQAADRTSWSWSRKLGKERPTRLQVERLACCELDLRHRIGLTISLNSSAADGFWHTSSVSANISEISDLSVVSCDLLRLAAT